jgi:hypothetical protein
MSLVVAATADGYIEHLRRDLESGAWDRAHGHLRTQPAFDGSLRLLVSRPRNQINVTVPVATS